MTRRLSLHTEAWATKQAFRITGYEWTEVKPVICAIEQDGCVGYGEAHGVYYLQESAATLLTQLEEIASQIEAGANRQTLQDLLPPGGARNAVDCALWDLEAQLAGRSVWELAGVAAGPVETVFTIGLEDDAEQMAARARDAQGHTLLKIKLDGHQPLERLRAIRAARPDARLVVDANQGWSFEQLKEIAPGCAELGISMIEQPLPRGGDAELAGYTAPLPLCADESCLHRGELEQAANRYQMINIKLDKAGGLTEALLLARAAKERGLELMVGSMVGTSMAMAPTHVVAQLCRYVDIDGPLLLKNDRLPGLHYESGKVSVPERDFWGLPRGTK